MRPKQLYTKVCIRIMRVYGNNQFQTLGTYWEIIERIQKIYFEVKLKFNGTFSFQVHNNVR